MSSSRPEVPTVSSLKKSVIGALLLGSFVLALGDWPVRALWPSLVALATVLVLRRVLLGLLAGAAAGVVIIEGGDPIASFSAFFGDHLIPALGSPWRTGAILFTFILGGFAAVIEKGGGLQDLVRRVLRSGRGPDPARRLQTGAFLLGMVLFFDGLANSLMVGSMLRDLADRCGVSRVKLAYLVDSTSSAVACLAFVSTWITYQMAMIREGYTLAGRLGEADPYRLFFQSIPYNFYCLFTILLLIVMILRDFNPGPMRTFELVARKAAQADRKERDESISEVSGLDSSTYRIWAAVVPVLVLIGSLLGGIYLGGVHEPWPVSGAKVTKAFGGDHVVIALVCASALASILACILYPGGPDRPSASQAFLSGVETFFFPILILISAWTLSSTLGELGAADVLARLLSDRLPVFAFPVAVFLMGAVISFTTGTSWGTMGILMPLAISVLFNLGSHLSPQDFGILMAAVVGAVFSGAVFGDHCSPISDTTIVSSIACEIEPHAHVRTQLPYALLTAIGFASPSFVLIGLGVPVWFVLAVAVCVLWFLPSIYHALARLWG